MWGSSPRTKRGVWVEGCALGFAFLHTIAAFLKHHHVNRILFSSALRGTGFVGGFSGNFFSWTRILKFGAASLRWGETPPLQGLSSLVFTFMWVWSRDSVQFSTSVVCLLCSRPCVRSREKWDRMLSFIHSPSRCWLGVACVGP